MRGLNPEQLLIIADEFCANSRVARVAVADFSALAACAAVPGAKFHGIAVHSSAEAAAQALRAAITALRPLTADNEDFAAAAAEVYLQWAE